MPRGLVGLPSPAEETRRGEAQPSSLPPAQTSRRPRHGGANPGGLGVCGRSVNVYGSGRPGGAGAMAFGSVNPARPRRTESSAGGHLPCRSGALPAPRGDPSLLSQPLGAGIVRPAGSGLKRGRRGGSEAGSDPSPPRLKSRPERRLPGCGWQRGRARLRLSLGGLGPSRSDAQSLAAADIPAFRTVSAPPRRPGHPLARSRRLRSPRAARPRRSGALPERRPDALWQRAPGQGGRRRGTAGPTDAPPGGGQAAPARRHGSWAPASLLHPLPPAFVRLPSSAPLRFVARRFLSARAREASAG